MKYRILRGEYWHDELVKVVQEYLDAGWICQGGVTCNGSGMFFQAMILIEEGDKENDNN